MSSPEFPGPVPSISVPEVRDYVRINQEIVRLLNEGNRRIRLSGVEGQRLLASGLKGDWGAVIEVQGSAGPELASDLDAPGLTVVCHGSAADGAGRGLSAGSLLILGRAGNAVGYTQSGGTIVVLGEAEHRAGLDQSGGWLILAGKVGRLAADRQTGGTIALLGEPIGPSFGHGRRGGTVLRRGTSGYDEIPGLRDAIQPLLPWIPPDLLRGMRENA